MTRRRFFHALVHFIAHNFHAVLTQVFTQFSCSAYAWFSARADADFMQCSRKCSCERIRPHGRPTGGQCMGVLGRAAWAGAQWAPTRWARQHGPDPPGPCPTDAADWAHHEGLAHWALPWGPAHPRIAYPLCVVRCGERQTWARRVVLQADYGLIGPGWWRL